MADHDRRSLLRWACHGLGAVFAAVLGVPAALYLVDPRNREAATGAFRPVSGVKLSEVGSVPVQGVIRDVHRDAWTLHPNDVVGRVWVVRVRDGSTKDCYQVFTTVCPHLGCSINCNTAPTVHFKCPCHDAEFNLDGSRVLRPNYQNAAPRAMDTLEFDVQGDDLLVKFELFKAGQEAKEVRS